MAEWTGRIEIARPPADVFAFLADLRNMPRYLPTVRRVGRPEHHAGHDDIAIEGEADDRPYRDVGWLKAEPEARRLRWGSHDLPSYGGALDVTETAGGAAVALHLALTPRPEVAARMQRDHGSVEHGMRIALERTLGRIKACCESQDGAAAEPEPARDDLPDSRPFGSSATLNPDI